MNDGLEYGEMAEEFFRTIAEKRLDAMVSELLKKRVDRSVRELMLTPDRDVSNILKGQISICYELADGITRARAELKSEAKDEGSARPPEELFVET